MEGSHFTKNVLYRIQGFSRAYPRVWLYLAGLSAGSFAMAYKAILEQREAIREIAFRKERLSQEVYEVKGTDFPWNKENIQEWLYRPIKITGRPIHAKTMMVSQVVDEYKGYNYIVPLVLKENDDGSNQIGILFNKGWIPHEYRHPAARLRIENVLPQTFIGYLSKATELDEKTSFFKVGNSPGQGRNRWGHVYLPDMAKATGFKNSDAVQVAIVEHVNLDTPLDERSPAHWDKTLGQQEDFPYKKTRAGALQLKTMPWELDAQIKNWINAGLLTGGATVLLKLLVQIL